MVRIQRGPGGESRIAHVDKLKLCLNSVDNSWLEDIAQRPDDNPQSDELENIVDEILEIEKTSPHNTPPIWHKEFEIE